MEEECEFPTFSVCKLQQQCLNGTGNKAAFRDIENLQWDILTKGNGEISPCYNRRMDIILGFQQGYLCYLFSCYCALNMLY